MAKKTALGNFVLNDKEKGETGQSNTCPSFFFLFLFLFNFLNVN